MLESSFQSRLIKTIKKDIPGSIVYKNDGNYIQGFPDITVYYKDKYAVLECKCSERGKHQPNQDYYISKFNNLAFGRFICPENQKEVLTELKKYLEN